MFSYLVTDVNDTNVLTPDDGDLGGIHHLLGGCAAGVDARVIQRDVVDDQVSHEGPCGLHLVPAKTHRGCERM